MAAALVVLGVHKASLLVRIADYQFIGAGYEWHQAIFQGIAHQQNGVVPLAVSYCELIHDPGVDTHILILSALGQQGNLYLIRISAQQRQEGITGHDFDGSGR
ncbi:hypothetical protein D3C74_374180 [compost metagenome]